MSEFKSKIINNFITNYFEKYLIGDIKTILQLKDSEIRFGGLGYTCTLLVLIAMELIGEIDLEAKTKDGTTKTNIKSPEIKHFIGLMPAKYNSNNVDNILVDSVRNGIAHCFMPNYGVAIGLKNCSHLDINSDGNILINAEEFFNDFFKVYINIKTSWKNNEEQVENVLIKISKRLDNEKTKPIIPKTTTLEVTKTTITGTSPVLSAGVSPTFINKP